MAYETRQPEERAVLFSIVREGRGEESSVEELAGLVRSAGATPVGRLLQRRSARHPATYFGTGKVRELRALVQATGADVAICDDELTPLQMRNLGDELDLKVADRTTVILDIFARRAQSRAGKLQVEMAQLTYRLPRLVGRYSALSRLGAGIGTRGPGETKLEVDRRRIRQRLDDLRAQLKEVEAHRALQRVERRARGYPLITLVGYTNAGKSTLLNALTSGGALVRDVLFATLDPTSRELDLPDGRRAILTDTVGFIRKLPTSLVAAFRATLEEVVASDLLLEVYDLSSAHAEVEHKTVDAVLREIGARDVPSLRVYNKADLFDALPVVDGVVVSGQSGDGLEDLRAEIARALPGAPLEVELRVPYGAAEVQSWLHRVGRVLEEDYQDEAVRMRVELSPLDAQRARREIARGEGGRPAGAEAETPEP